MCLPFDPAFPFLGIYHKEVVKDVHGDMAGRFSHGGMLLSSVRGAQTDIGRGVECFSKMYQELFCIVVQKRPFCLS